MLEHAHGDDAVERAAHVAIVGQLEADLVGNARRRGPLARDRQLLLREGDAQHLRPGRLMQIQRHAAPAAADVEAAHAGSDRELGGDVRLFVGLCPVEVLGAGIGPISAAVLPVGVEEQRVELRRQVVVMRHVAARTEPGVGGQEAVAQLAGPPPRHAGPVIGRAAILASDLVVMICAPSCRGSSGNRRVVSRKWPR